MRCNKNSQTTLTSHWQVFMWCCITDNWVIEYSSCSRGKSKVEKNCLLTNKTKVPKVSAMHSRTRAFLALTPSSLCIAGVKSLFSFHPEISLFLSDRQVVCTSRRWWPGVTSGINTNKRFLSRIPLSADVSMLHSVFSFFPPGKSIPHFGGVRLEIGWSRVHALEFLVVAQCHKTGVTWWQQNKRQENTVYAAEDLLLQKKKEKLMASKICVSVSCQSAQVHRETPQITLTCWINKK